MQYVVHVIVFLQMYMFKLNKPGHQIIIIFSNSIPQQGKKSFKHIPAVLHFFVLLFLLLLWLLQLFPLHFFFILFLSSFLIQLLIFHLSFFKFFYNYTNLKTSSFNLLIKLNMKISSCCSLNLSFFTCFIPKKLQR